ncbi:carbohydrate ABC transporter permease [Paracraurococcus lichenis]|uniref:Sugar ABC transporter permease n=1 Tax=Paracraurococcus lichenis TaxID=3064888 RepID=A0ABT9E289_9PROT|nr:sugar ABC transporter permease [Paracraurococcus sp. LOR1-02]MDO9710145.1 sugar ABC transporter permease [Paracraurococcus sp. LOR1-02]
MSEISGAAPRPLVGLSEAPAARGLRRAPLDRAFLPLAVGPTFLVMLAVFGLPLLFSLWLSLTGWSPQQGMFDGAYVGLANFEDLLSDRIFMGSLGVTFGFTAAAVAAQLGLGLGIALLLNLDLPGMRGFRTALVLPMMVTPIVGALCWKLLLDPNHGVVNHWLGTHIVWLGRPETALVAVWLVNVWHSTPYVALILLAGLRSLPHEPHEAAEIDGASRWQVFRHVTLPLLQPFLLVALLLRTIFEFRAFDNVYAMTGGGPANATMLLSMYTYLTSFVRFDFGLGAAAAWLMLLMSMAMCLLFIAVLRRRGPR